MGKKRELIKVVYETYFDENTHLKVHSGNKKTGKGIWLVNLLPGDTPLTKNDGTVLTNVAGSCGGCCQNCKKDCYAARYVLFHHNSCVPSYASNTVLARHDVKTFFKELQDFIDRNIVSVIRLHSSGEIPTKEYLIEMVKIAKANPMVIFYTYTKRFKWLEEVIDEYGDLPNNLIINVSIWHKNYDNPLNLPEFIYDDGTEPELENLFHCPAVERGGRDNNEMTCSSCKRCFKAKKGDKIAVYAH